VNPRKDIANKFWEIEKYHRGIKYSKVVEKDSGKRKKLPKEHLMSTESFSKTEVAKNQKMEFRN
jgi:hypothetical protein